MSNDNAYAAARHCRQEALVTESAETRTALFSIARALEAADSGLKRLHVVCATASVSAIFGAGASRLDGNGFA